MCVRVSTAKCVRCICLLLSVCDVSVYCSVCVMCLSTAKCVRCVCLSTAKCVRCVFLSTAKCVRCVYLLAECVRCVYLLLSVCAVFVCFSMSAFFVLSAPKFALCLSVCS